MNPLLSRYKQKWQDYKLRRNSKISIQQQKIEWKNIYGQPAPSAHFILSHAPRFRKTMLHILKRLDFDPYADAVINFHQEGLRKFGPDWDFIDLPLLALSASHFIQPQDYLEIGVRRGRSLCCVYGGHPKTRLFGIDLWVQNYAGIPNPGPQFVESQLRRLGLETSNQLSLGSGDSHEILPNFPDASFDMITVDGDHSEEGAIQDLHEAYRILRPGGAILFDDIIHPQHPYLSKVWTNFANQFQLDWDEYDASGYGVAIGIKRHLKFKA